MKILGIDSCTTSCGSALYCDGRITASYTNNNKLTHSENLLPTIDAMLKNADVKISELDYIAVTTGPGSFTGIRIGLATAKGIAHSRNIPMIAVSALEALAFNGVNFDGIICPCFDARRNQVYNALFEYRNAVMLRLTSDRAISAEDLSEELIKTGRKFLVLGDGKHVLYSLTKENPNCSLAPENTDFLSASGLCCAAAAQTADCTFRALSYDEVTPVYLRLSQAEREKLEKEKNNENNNR